MQARASGDYQPTSDKALCGTEQWKIGITSLFADAMGIAPFKDTFWTTTNQSGNFYKGANSKSKCSNLNSLSIVSMYFSN